MPSDSQIAGDTAFDAPGAGDAPGGGYNWGALGMSALGAGTMGLGFLGQGSSMSTPLSSNGGYLPFSDDLYGNMGKLRALIASTEGSQPLPQDFGAAMEYARADAARRGIQGPLAARMGAEASNDYMNKYSQLRFDRLNQLLGAQSQLGLQLQDREEERRKYMAQLAAQKHAAEQARLSGIFRLGGTLLGGGLGMLGGPAGAAAGAGLGGAFGGALPSMFDTGY